MADGIKHGATSIDRAYVGSDRALDLYMGGTQVVNQSAETILGEAVWWIDATDTTAGDQTVANKGTGGAALNAQAGSAGTADSNDPKFLAHTGTDYVYLPGVAGNYLSVPDEAALDITGDIDIRVHVALDDWTPAAQQVLSGKYGSGATTRSFNLQLSAGGLPTFVWVTAAQTTRSAGATAYPAVADGADLWLRATLDVDNGSSQYEVKFYTSADGSSWTQLGSTVTGSTGVTDIQATSEPVLVGAYATGSLPAAGKFYRTIIKNGIDGTTVLDVDTSVITSGSAASFTAVTGQTVTINRSTSGRKSVAVVAPVWLLGTDDYFEVADNALLDFAAADSFTVLSVRRAWATLSTGAAMVAKKANTTATTQGWALTTGTTTAAQGQLQFGDGTAGVTAVSGSRASGELAVFHGVRRVAADTGTVFLNSTAGTPVTDSTTGALANGEVMRVGRLSGAGAGYANAEVFAAAVWRRPLTSGEITILSAYFSARCP